MRLISISVITGFLCTTAVVLAQDRDIFPTDGTPRRGAGDARLPAAPPPPPATNGTVQLMGITMPLPTNVRTIDGTENNATNPNWGSAGRLRPASRSVLRRHQFRCHRAGT